MGVKTGNGRSVGLGCGEEKAWRGARRAIKDTRIEGGRVKVDVGLRLHHPNVMSFHQNSTVRQHRGIFFSFFGPDPT